jgi:hypothetical protein
VIRSMPRHGGPLPFCSRRHLLPIDEKKEYPQRNQSVDILNCQLGHYRNAEKFAEALPTSFSVAQRSLFVTPV